MAEYLMLRLLDLFQAADIHGGHDFAAALPCLAATARPQETAAKVAWERNAGPGGQLGQMEATMRPLLAILIYDRDALFREALRNFLLAAGYGEVVIAATVRETLTKLRCESYGHILIGISTPLSHGRRLAAIARRRQPEAKILFLVSAQDQPFARDAAFEYVMKEYVFSNLLGLM